MSPFNHSGVMSGEELANLEDALLFHRSHDLERRVRGLATLSAKSCLASARPWDCVFRMPGEWENNGAAPDGGTLPPPSSGFYVEVTVDVRGARDPFAATLIAEEQIRRQLAKHPWAKLPDLAASR